MTYRPPQILSPIPIVKYNTAGYCSMCEREHVATYEHSNYPGMTLCVHCIYDHTGLRTTYIAKDYDMWESAAKAQGREIVPRV